MSVAQDPNILILYATETGTAQGVADRISDDCRRFHIKTRVINIESYPPADIIAEPIVIFVVATTGAGTEPRSMTPLWKMLLRSDLPADLFEDMIFAVFGLGDTSYEKFCWPARLLSRRLCNLGAIEICPRGEGDEQHDIGIEGGLDPWMKLLLNELASLYPVPDGLDIISRDSLPPPRISLTQEPSSTHVQDTLAVDNVYHLGRVRCNNRITASDWTQDVRHLEFDFGVDLNYLPGDVAVIHPEISSVDVEAFITAMGWANDIDTPFQIIQGMTHQSLPDHLPTTTTLREIFTRYVDFSAVPRRGFFQLLRHFTADKTEREKLNEFLSTEGADELYQYCHRVRRTIREVLADFHHARIPKEYIFDLFPPLRPREFSIASSGQEYPRQIHLCVAIVRYRTQLKVPRKGVCTTFLARLRPGDVLRIGVKRGVLKLPPEDSDAPVICIGPGTGVAPMRAVVQSRLGKSNSDNKGKFYMSKTLLYFGCRSATKDQHYEEEWKAYAKGDTTPFTYRVACSRDGPEGVAKVYVQDLLRQDAEKLWNLVSNEAAWVMISGSSNKMPAAVKDALRFAAQSIGQKTKEQADAFIADMEKEGRLCEECWS